jgi:hypothetical protein
MANELSSTIDINNVEYNINAKNAENAVKANKVVGTLTIKAGTETVTFDGSANKRLDINLTYSNSTPTVNALGGVAANTTFNNKSITEVLDMLLYPYIAPTLNSITLDEAAGTFEYGTEKRVTKVTPYFKKGSEEITSIKIGTTNGGDDLYSKATATNGVAITLTNSKVYNGKTGGTIYCTIGDGQKNSTAFAKIEYKYYDYSKLTTSTTPDTSGATKQTSSGADDTYSYSANQYLWLYSRDSGKKIQTYVAGSWADVTTTTHPVTVELTLVSGAKVDYYAYRTDKFTADGQARYRLA